jgi:hypothetical protein
MTIFYITFPFTSILLALEISLHTIDGTHILLSLVKKPSSITIPNQLITIN